MRNLVGRTWGSLTEKEQDNLYETVIINDFEMSITNIKNGEGVIDFESGLSIVCKVVNYEISIENDSILYDSEA